MAVWNKPAERPADEIAALQARIDADEMTRRFRAGYGNPNDAWQRVGGGRVKDPDQFSKYVKSAYQIPDGYDVSQDGRVVYANETPWLKQALMAAAPVAIPAALGAIGSAGAATGLTAGAGSTLGAATPIPGVLGAAAGGATLGTGAAAGGAGMGVWGTLGKIAQLAGPALSNRAQASAENRGTTLDAQALMTQLQQMADAQYNRDSLAREQEGRIGRDDAWKKLQNAQYVQTGTQNYTAPKVSIAGASMPSFGFGPRAATDVERQGAMAMEAEVMKRLLEGNPLPQVTRREPEMDMRLTKPTGAERLQDWLGMGLNGLGAWQKLRG